MTLHGVEGKGGRRRIAEGVRLMHGYPGKIIEEVRRRDEVSC